MSDYMTTLPPQPENEEPKAVSAPTKSKNALSIASLCTSAVALVLSLCTLLMILPPREAEPIADPAFPAPGTIVTYKGYQLPAYEQLPLNPHDSSVFSLQNGRVRYNGAAKVMTGVDVSVYQNDIDWKQVKAAGIDFAMIRVGFRGYGPSGVLSEDSRFRQNIAGALDAGLQVGVYLFSQATNVWEAQEEANLVLNAIKDYNVTLPVVFDWERITNATARTDGLPGGTVTLCAKTFCDTIAQAGYKPMVYFNLDLGYLGYDLSQLKDYGFWLAEYRTTPTFFYDFDMWQYTAKGSVPGIKGDVDLNLYFVQE